MDGTYSTASNPDGPKPKLMESNVMYTQDMQIPGQQRDIIQHTFVQQKHHEHNYAYDLTIDQLQRKQKERNRIIAEKLSPLSKYKMQEYMRRTRVRGIQRRKFSLLMGLPPADKRRATVVVSRQTVPSQQMDPNVAAQMASHHQQNMVQYDQQQPMQQNNYGMNDMGRFDGEIELD